MPRPSLPNTDEIVGIAKALKAEGFAAVCIRTEPSGAVSISIGQGDAAQVLSPLDEWKAKSRAAS